MKFLEIMQNYGFKIDVLALPERNATASATPTVWHQRFTFVHVCGLYGQAGQPDVLTILANVKKRNRET